MPVLWGRMGPWACEVAGDVLYLINKWSIEGGGTPHAPLPVSEFPRGPLIEAGLVSGSLLVISPPFLIINVHGQVTSLTTSELATHAHRDSCCFPFIIGYYPTSIIPTHLLYQHPHPILS